MSVLGKRNYQGMLGDRRANIGPLLPPAMGGGFRRVKRASVGSRKAYNRRPRQELKFFDTTISTLADTTMEIPATGGQLVLIPQGDSDQTRDGRMAYVKSVQIRGTVTYQPAAAANAATCVHMWLVQDKQTNGAAAGATDVFTSTDASLALRNINNASRFKILKHFRVDLNANAGVTTAYNQVVKSLEYYTACDIPITYSSTTGAITEIRSNNLFLLLGSTNTDDVVTVSGVARVRFYD